MGRVQIWMLDQILILSNGDMIMGQLPIMNFCFQEFGSLRQWACNSYIGA